jgi:lipoprotein-anchoring transpeptidase ErfK/SrfK
LQRILAFVFVTILLAAPLASKGEARSFAAVVSYSSRTIYFVRTGKTEPVAIPYTTGLWCFGAAEISRIEKDPRWTPTENIRRRMLAQGVRLEQTYRPWVVDKRNPLGPYMLHLNFLDQPCRGPRGIHGNNNAASVGTMATSGCFRLHNETVVQSVEGAWLEPVDIVHFRR